MKKGIVLIIIMMLWELSYCQYNYLKTDKITSEKQILSDTINTYPIINKYYNGGLSMFIRNFQENFNYPDIARRLCSEAYAIVKCTFKNDTSIIYFNNYLGLGYEEAILKALNKVKNNFNKLPKEGITIIFSIFIEYDIPDKRKTNMEYNSLIKTNVFSDGGILGDGYCYCFYKDDEHMLDLINTYVNANLIDIAKAYIMELKRRQPFNEEVESLYKKYIKE